MSSIDRVREAEMTPPEKPRVQESPPEEVEETPPPEDTEQARSQARAEAQNARDLGTA